MNNILHRLGEKHGTTMPVMVRTWEGLLLADKQRMMLTITVPLKCLPLGMRLICGHSFWNNR